MTINPSPPAPLIRDSEEKLYQICLDACIDGFEKLQIRKQEQHDKPASLAPEQSTTHLLSPPPSLAITQFRPLTSSLLLSPASSDIMGRSTVHGTPPQNTPPLEWASQDARSTLAVQPALNSTSLKLKKNAVKIVGPAVTIPNTQTKPIVPVAPITTPAQKPVSPEMGTVEQNNSVESILDEIFARLTVSNAMTSTRTVPSGSPVRPDKSIFLFEDRVDTTASIPSNIVQSDMASMPSHPSNPKHSETVISNSPLDKVDKSKSNIPLQEAKDEENGARMSQTALENEYLRKASEYVNSLPNSKGTIASTFKVVAEKLRISHVPDAELDSANIERIKKRYIFAITSYINQVLRKDLKPLTNDFVMHVLQANGGSFLALCATLVEEKYMTLANISEVTGLCHAILDILPKAEPSITTPIRTVAPGRTTPAVEKAKSEALDLIDDMETWPTPEKRENAASCRTCVLKGVSGVGSINQLQALVWGGRLESISLPEPGSDFALVKFLSPEACHKYFEATENGIKVGGDKTKVVFVEKTIGPNSINDVTRKCIENDVTRCVRAVGADDEWSDMMLLKLATGNSLIKREVDRVKRGQTVRGHNYVEFRFANIYHALSFRRQLVDDQEWEHCTIGYAPDPCETALGVHNEDEEEGNTSFA